MINWFYYLSNTHAAIFVLYVIYYMIYYIKTLKIEIMISLKETTIRSELANIINEIPLVTNIDL